MKLSIVKQLCEDLQVVENEYTNLQNIVAILGSDRYLNLQMLGFATSSYRVVKITPEGKLFLLLMEVE